MDDLKRSPVIPQRRKPGEGVLLPANGPRLFLLLKSVAGLTVFAFTLTGAVPPGWAGPSKSDQTLRVQAPLENGVEAGLEERLRSEIKRREMPIFQPELDQLRFLAIDQDWAAVERMFRKMGEFRSLAAFALISSPGINRWDDPDELARLVKLFADTPEFRIAPERLKEPVRKGLAHLKGRKIPYGLLVSPSSEGEVSWDDSKVLPRLWNLAAIGADSLSRILAYTLEIPGAAAAASTDSYFDRINDFHEQAARYAGLLHRRYPRYRPWMPQVVRSYAAGLEEGSTRREWLAQAMGGFLGWRAAEAGLLAPSTFVALWLRKVHAHHGAGYSARERAVYGSSEFHGHLRDHYQVLQRWREASSRVQSGLWDLIEQYHQASEEERVGLWWGLSRETDRWIAQEKENAKLQIGFLEYWNGWFDFKRMGSDYAEVAGVLPFTHPLRLMEREQRVRLEQWELLEKWNRQMKALGHLLLPPAEGFSDVSFLPRPGTKRDEGGGERAMEAMGESVQGLLELEARHHRLQADRLHWENEHTLLSANYGRDHPARQKEMREADVREAMIPVMSARIKELEAMGRIVAARSPEARLEAQEALNEAVLKGAWAREGVAGRRLNQRVLEQREGIYGPDHPLSKVWLRAKLDVGFGELAVETARAESELVFLTRQLGLPLSSSSRLEWDDLLLFWEEGQGQQDLSVLSENISRARGEAYGQPMREAISKAQQELERVKQMGWRAEEERQRGLQSVMEAQGAFQRARFPGDRVEAQLGLFYRLEQQQRIREGVEYQQRARKQAERDVAHQINQYFRALYEMESARARQEKAVLDVVSAGLSRQAALPFPVNVEGIVPLVSPGLEKKPEEEEIRSIVSAFRDLERARLEREVRQREMEINYLKSRVEDEEGPYAGEFIEGRVPADPESLRDLSAGERTRRIQADVERRAQGISRIQQSIRLVQAQREVLMSEWAMVASPERSEAVGEYLNRSEAVAKLEDLELRHLEDLLGSEPSFAEDPARAEALERKRDYLLARRGRNQAREDGALPQAAPQLTSGQSGSPSSDLAGARPSVQPSIPPHGAILKEEAQKAGPSGSLLVSHKGRWEPAPIQREGWFWLDSPVWMNGDRFPKIEFVQIPAGQTGEGRWVPKSWVLKVSAFVPHEGRVRELYVEVSKPWLGYQGPSGYYRVLGAEGAYSLEGVPQFFDYSRTDPDEKGRVRHGFVSQPVDRWGLNRGAPEKIPAGAVVRRLPLGQIREIDARAGEGAPVSLEPEQTPDGPVVGRLYEIGQMVEEPTGKPGVSRVRYRVELVEEPDPDLPGQTRRVPRPVAVERELEIPAPKGKSPPIQPQGGLEEPTAHIFDPANADIGRALYGLHIPDPVVLLAAGAAQEQAILGSGFAGVVLNVENFSGLEEAREAARALYADSYAVRFYRVEERSRLLGWMGWFIDRYRILAVDLAGFEAVVRQWAALRSA